MKQTFSQKIINGILIFTGLLSFSSAQAANKCAALHQPRMIVIVDPYSSGNLYAPLAKKDSNNFILGIQSQHYREDIQRSYTGEGLDKLIVADNNLAITTRAQKVAREILSMKKPIAGVIAGYEGGVEFTFVLAEILRARGVPITTNGVHSGYRDKAVLGKLLESHGFNSAKNTLASSYEEALQWITENGIFRESSVPSAIVKPVDGASGEGVHAIRNAQDLYAAFRAELGEQGRYGNVNQKLLVMEYLDGKEVVIDTVRATSPDGKETIDILTDSWDYNKRLKPNGDKMYNYDILRVPDAEVEHYFELVNRAADILGYKNGPIHAELIITRNGPYIIDMGFRAMGSGQPRLVEAATGHSQVSLQLLSMTDWHAFKKVPRIYTRKKAAAMVTLMPHHDGVMGDNEANLALARQLKSYSRGAAFVPSGTPVKEGNKLSDNVAQVELVGTDENSLLKDVHYVLSLPWVNYKK